MTYIAALLHVTRTGGMCLTSDLGPVIGERNVAMESGISICRGDGTCIEKHRRTQYEEAVEGRDVTASQFRRSRVTGKSPSGYEGCDGGYATF